MNRKINCPLCSSEDCYTYPSDLRYKQNNKTFNCKSCLGKFTIHKWQKVEHKIKYERFLPLPKWVV